ncbi:NAD(P)/FAD-dependent oxidoreductase [Ruania zhangjianzhongii]|uniref:FAD/NAD(P)-dependent oxidoreductase n=1 Tax=Ruania zhangjianzhongii TaxID=2603206 RepID=UPI0011C73C8C|nr:NAD(P)/FAD-dependent oxidoreductase [Ruania zhangjianzhongii]
MSTTDPQPAAAPSHLDYDVVVVGGGPSGLVTARELATAGARVALIEESAELGGQYYKRRRGQVLARHGDFRPAGTALIAQVRQAGVQVHTNRLVWGTTPDRALLTTSTTSPDAVRFTARAIVVGTGATEHVLPFPGWQLPGVITPGHAMHLATTDVVRVGQRVLIAGSGPFLLPVACAVLASGSEVAAVVEAGRPLRPSARALGAAAHPGMLGELARYLTVLARHRVPILQGAHVSESTAGPDGRLRTVSIATTTGNRSFDVDTLATAVRFRPATELLQLLEVECSLDPELGVPIPDTDARGATSAPGVYAVGEARGIAGSKGAQVRGWLAAATIREELGLSAPPERAVRRYERRSRRLDDFSRLTSDLYAHDREPMLAMPDHTMVCRCESVTAGEIRTAARLGWNDRNGVKGATRAGMGPCQGRECASTVSCLVSACTGEPVGCQPARMPVKPIPVRAAMAMEERQL